MSSKNRAGCCWSVFKEQVGGNEARKEGSNEELLESVEVQGRGYRLRTGA